MHFEAMLIETQQNIIMLDTKFLKLEKDTDGKVSLSEVIDMLKDLQHDVHCSIQQIKTEKARKNRQKLYGIPKALNVIAVPI